MNTYGARPEVIAIPVDEYKELLAANTELNHLSQVGKLHDYHGKVHISRVRSEHA